MPFARTPGPAQAVRSCRRLRSDARQTRRRVLSGMRGRGGAFSRSLNLDGPSPTGPSSRPCALRAAGPSPRRRRELVYDNFLPPPPGSQRGPGEEKELKETGRRPAFVRGDDGDEAGARVTAGAKLREPRRGWRARAATRPAKEPSGRFERFGPGVLPWMSRPSGSRSGPDATCAGATVRPIGRSEGLMIGRVRAWTGPVRSREQTPLEALTPPPFPTSSQPAGSAVTRGPETRRGWERERSGPTSPTSPSTRE